MCSYDTAALLFGASDKIREDIKAPLPLPKQKDRQESEERAKAGLKDLVLEWDAGMKKGRDLSLEHILGIALQKK